MTLYDQIDTFLEGVVVRKNPSSLLDIGCGEGGFLAKVQEKHPAWTLGGLESMPDNVSFARKNVPRATFESASVTGNLYPFSARKWDAVTLILSTMRYKLEVVDKLIGNITNLLSDVGTIYVLDVMHHYYNDIVVIENYNEMHIRATATLRNLAATHGLEATFEDWTPYETIPINKKLPTDFRTVMVDGKLCCFRGVVYQPFVLAILE